MATFLKGPNFSGRSHWMEERRKHMLWPKILSISASAETAYSGLARTVGEEVALSSEKCSGKKRTRVVHQFGVQDLMERELHTLSGGELVRTATAVALLLSPHELHIDGAFEQLDMAWRKKSLTIVNKSDIKNIVVVDNHYSDNDLALFDKVIHFPLTATRVDQKRFAVITERAGNYFPSVDPLPISINDLSFRYSGSKVNVFKNCNVCFESGNVYFLTGANGSGKTTLVKLLSGALPIRKGSISYGTETFNPRRSSKRYAALAFQNPDYQWTSNSIHHEIARLGKPNKEEQIETLEYFGIDPDLLHSNPIELPFVIKKRLGIALASISGKSWLILDEPTLGQDRHYCESLTSFLNSALKKGIGVLVISHDASFKQLFPNARTVVFERGLFKDCGT